MPQVTLEAFLVGLAVVAIGGLIAWAVPAVVALVQIRGGRSPSSAHALRSLFRWTLMIVAVLAGLAVMFPSIDPVDVLGGLGVISIAAGIGFQTVLGNIFAGVVILSRDRYRPGDQIWVGEVKGTIVEIRISSTSIRTFDERLVLVPNTTLHNEQVVVQTGYENVRTAVAVAIDQRNDLALASSVAVEAMRKVPGVLAQPEPEALFASIDPATVGLELRFWAGATQMETLTARHEVVVKVAEEFAAHGITIGSDVVVIEAGTELGRILRHQPAEGSSEAGSASTSDR